MKYKDMINEFQTSLLDEDEEDEEERGKEEE